MSAHRMPLIVASENGRAGALAAMELLRRGGSALDAVELACRVTEDDPNDHSVGYGGIPNVLGEVELDASIMDGRTLRIGAVAAVRGYGHPITLARRVMEELPHVLLVGHGAERLAAELGQPPADQRTPAGMSRWRARFAEHGLPLPPNEDRPTWSLRALATRLTRPLNLQAQVQHAGKPDTLGTVNFLALDQEGNLASGVSTSGMAWKYPGRVGDSPIIGAGNYCDNRYGAAACTGLGELAIRVSSARSVVLYLKMGLSLQEAGLEALRDLAYLPEAAGQYMNIVAMTPTGEHAGFSTVPGKQYLFMAADMDEPQLAERILLPHAP
ncbi:N(4)-(beta-N-acetylglucosaminyl)-L-asparaginase [Litorilinea aerophila]|nr:N(4)-(beta-N-acetylglucosaminyl)-L-asparaginase [Litorilinea aerophila]MCC9077300.1 N(4)-(beta-N-acetylglucosaminyl)-L-asparaginase [Litorilinea aerophila]